MSLSEMLEKMLGNSDNDNGCVAAEAKKDDGVQPEGGKQNDHEDGQKETENPDLFNRDNRALIEDKTLLDLVIAVEQTVRSKQLSDQNVDDLRKRLEDSKKQNELIREDLDRTQRLVEQRDEQIEDLESKNADKNVQIDQVLEQYRNLESDMSETVDELKNKLDVEEKKYQKLYEDSEKQNEEAMRKIKEKEAVIHELEGENTSLKRQLDEIKEQNDYLMNIVRDFTDQVSGSFTPLDDDTDEGETCSEEANDHDLK